MSLTSKKYEGTTKNGQQIDVFFFDLSESVKALAMSDELTAIFINSSPNRWTSHAERLTDEWGPVVAEAYERYLDDIISGDKD